MKEQQFIRKNEDRIIKRANSVYAKRTNEEQRSRLPKSTRHFFDQMCLDFLLLEQRAKLYHHKSH
ncbi:hypothetical protein FD08_GL002473 [Lentilactobacillus parakefiri DSM 10551]|nr:hypothetical protein FD08_GL002473 [Lentilactobacillus parakefiri DSM 10551]